MSIAHREKLLARSLPRPEALLWWGEGVGSALTAATTAPARSIVHVESERQLEQTTLLPAQVFKCSP